MSCAYKANLISVIYLGILLAFLKMEDKARAMMLMTVTIGVALLVQYLMVLTNLTSFNTPSKFPLPFKTYPSSGSSNANNFAIPWFLHLPKLRNNLSVTYFLGIDIDGSILRNMFFDFFIFYMLTLYFFTYGNPTISSSCKISFMQTKSLEDDLNDYYTMKTHRKALIKQHFNIDFDRAQQKICDVLKPLVGIFYELQATSGVSFDSRIDESVENQKEFSTLTDEEYGTMMLGLKKFFNQEIEKHNVFER